MKLASVRQAIHDALAWGHLKKQSGIVEYLEYLTRIQKTERDPDNAIADGAEAAYICIAIDSLPPKIMGWLKFAYGYDESQLIHAALAYELRRKFPVEQLKKNLRYQALCETSLEDYRYGLHRGRDLPLALYVERMGVSESNFSRDWGRDRRACLVEISRWDAEGVGQVSRMVVALRGDGELRPSEVLATYI